MHVHTTARSLAWLVAFAALASPCARAEEVEYLPPVALNTSFPITGHHPPVTGHPPAADFYPPTIGDHPTVTGDAPATAYPSLVGPQPQAIVHQLTAVSRAYYLNDQRLEFSGQEATFGVEGIVAGNVRFWEDGWEFGLDAELFLNQPFDRNILVDNAIRRSYAANFDVEPLELSQLALSARHGDFYCSVGKMVTPFGKAWFSLLTNLRADAPFIRTESILWRETGCLLQYSPQPFVATIALTNGSYDRDTNSSKAVISRLAIETDDFNLGASVKWQDGIGSENQKLFNNHLGLDMMFRTGDWRFSAEAIYDEYGLRKPFDPANITWGRSLYYREQHIGTDEPVQGFGFYVDAGYQSGSAYWSLNYGEYHPEAIGDARHDIVNRRTILKMICDITSHSQFYAAVLVENDAENAQREDAPRRGRYLLTGFQLTL